MDRAVDFSRRFLAGLQVNALTKRAQLYARRFDYDSAIADMDAAIELDADNPKLYTLRGQMVLLTYEWDAVLDDYNTAIALDPHDAAAYFHRGVLYYSILQTGLETRADALTNFEHYLELDPDGPFADEATQYIDDIRFELEALEG